MSLHVYDWIDEKKNSIPLEVVWDNDVFFDMQTKLSDIEIVRFFLKYIEKAKYNNECSVLDRDGCVLRGECLSTGCKTALNVVLNPNHCFSTVECGRNAKYAILKATTGSVLWLGGSVSVEDDGCDIIYKNLHFKSIKRFIKYFEEV